MLVAVLSAFKEVDMNRNCSDPDLKTMLIQMVKVWGKRPLKTLWKTRHLLSGLIRAQRKRKRMLKEEGLLVPMGIGLSPTMRCNLSCQGCYARFHSKEEEMSLQVIDSVVGSAREAGVFLFVITGGEPYLRPEMMDIYKKYRDVLFLPITNGTLIDEDLVADMSESGNIFHMVSIEGTEEQTDGRRGRGVHQKVLKCMRLFKQAGMLFGFSAVLTNTTVSTLGSSDFVGDMVSAGCSVGFYNEFIPLTSEEMYLVPDRNQRRLFKDHLDRLRKEEPIALIHLPDDEYDHTGRCTAVAGGGMHINAQGDVEPCPFAHFARENVKHNSFKEVLHSPFLDAIRKHPTVLQYGTIGCSLVNNRDILEEIAGSNGAKPTNRLSKAKPPGQY